MTPLSKAIGLLVFPLAFLTVLPGCGQSDGRGNKVNPVPTLRGRVIDALSYEGEFLRAPVIEHLDFGGAVLTTLTVKLNVAGDKEVLNDLFWESGKQVQILTPLPKKCVPTMFGITASGENYELKFWGWDNVGVNSDCEDMIYAMVQEGFHIKLKDVKWADIGLVKNFEVTLKALAPPKP